MSIAQRLSLQGKAAIVTGGGHGIGKVIAASLAECGASVAIADLSEEYGVKATEEINRQGHMAAYFPVDLRDGKSIAALSKAVGTHFGRIDILVNNARPKLAVAPFKESLAEWDLGLEVLLKAPALLSAACQELLAKNNGSIVNIVSVAAQFVSHQPAAYHVAKAGLVQLTRFLAVEFAPQKIRVNAVCPGLVDLFDENKPLTANPLHRQTAEIVVPLKRAGTAAEIADCVTFLCADAASYITGQVLSCDGGETLQDHFHVVREALKSGQKEKV
ncbi:MAG: SDR family oxidoreductase [Oligoflexia bacterium]|nr:SDR family oxidoreductase [Oligoflexia bacterium]